MATENNANIGFEKQIWDAACVLWGHIPAAEYRKVIVGLIFLRYISSAFEKRYQQLVDEGDGFEDDKDAYAEDNIFFVPEDARWSKIASAAHTPEIGTVIDDAMRAIEKENTTLKNVLPKNYASPDLDKRVLGDVVDLFTNMDMGDTEESKDLLGRTYEYCIQQFAAYEGVKGGEFYTPASIVKTIVAILKPFKNCRVYDPCCGSGGMFVRSAKFIQAHSGKRGEIAVYGQESNADTWKMAKMNMAIRGIDADFGPYQADTFFNDLHKTLKADFIMANPPFNLSNWGQEKLKDDVRWKYGTPPAGNANYAWIQHMLSYAFQVLNEQGYKQVATEEFDNVAELCAAILIKGVSLQIKRGLGKEYVVQSEPLSSLRGKIDISASVKQQSMLKKQLVCNYDEFSVNSYLNRIIRTTMDVLVRSEISKERKKQLRKLLIYFSEVKPLSRESINWKLQFNKNNQTYQMLISICYLILKGLLQTTSDGNTKLMDFLDEQRMCRLYEKFILEYYRKEHPEIRASASQIPWDTDDDYREMLPVMQSDITLKKGEKTLVIDAKYYSHTTQKQYDVNTLHSGNLYQIFTYVKNFDTERNGNVSGMLLYAKTDEVVLPNNEYKMGGNAISVKTLDLDCDFSEIRKQLDDIVYSCFGTE